MPLKLHHDIEVTVTDGRRLKLHRDLTAERAPRRGDMLFISLYNDDPAHSRRARIAEVLWSLDCSEAVVGSGPIEQVPPASLEELLRQGWVVANH